MTTRTRRTRSAPKKKLPIKKKLIAKRFRVIEKLDFEKLDEAISDKTLQQVSEWIDDLKLKYGNLTVRVENIGYDGEFELHIGELTAETDFEFELRVKGTAMKDGVRYFASPEKEASWAALEALKKEFGLK